MEDNRSKVIEAYSMLKAAERKSGFMIADGDIYVKARDLYEAVDEAEEIQKTVSPRVAGENLYDCPVCGMTVSKKYDNYCSHCGNKLLWEQQTVNYPLNYINCLRLLEACLKNNLAIRDPDNKDNMIFFKEGDEQPYSENVMDAARELTNDEEGQKYILSVLNEHHINVEFV